MGIMVVNNISYPIYPLSTRVEKVNTTKIIPFFFLFSICTKGYQISRKFTQKITRGDIWSAAIIGRLSVHILANDFEQMEMIKQTI